MSLQQASQRTNKQIKDVKYISSHLHKQVLGKNAMYELV